MSGADAEAERFFNSRKVVGDPTGCFVAFYLPGSELFGQVAGVDGNGAGAGAQAVDGAGFETIIEKR